MTRSIRLIFMMVVMALAGCSSAKQSILPELRILDMPTLNEERTSELGDTLVEKGKVYTYDGIRLENTISAGDGFFLKKLTLEPCTLKATLSDEERIYYTTEKLEVYDAIIGTQRQMGGLAISRGDSKDVRFHMNGITVMAPNTEPIISKAQVTDLERPNFRQELIYNGRSIDTLKFLYREYTTDILRAPFTQDIQYDLKDGKTIGFKGVRIEVIDATNVKIKYRVVSSFPDAL